MIEITSCRIRLFRSPTRKRGDLARAGKQVLRLITPGTPDPVRSAAGAFSHLRDKNNDVAKATPTTKSAALQRPHDPLELSLPDSALAPAGRSAAFARPPNITRSGENDEFGRGVIRALRRTMPSSERLGQVTIRLFLSETGNLLEARLIRSGGDPIMDQNVVFAAKQSSFPIPPNGATVADRTFLVTYVYH